MNQLTHLLVPVASAEDAHTTAAALEPYLDGIEQVTAVHVIEKADGAPDKAPIGKRQEDASSFLEIVETVLRPTTAVETRTVFATSVVPALFDEAAAVGADAIAFRARGGSRLIRLLSGDSASQLVTDPELPVISLPKPTDDS